MAGNSKQSEIRNGQPTGVDVQHQNPGVGDNRGGNGDGLRPGIMGGALRGGQPGGESHGGLPDNPRAVPATELEGLFTGGFVAPCDDGEATKRWPTLQLCMRAVVTRDGKPRAGGEVKTLADGRTYVTTLTMPEEGRMVKVYHDTLSNAWDALELTLSIRPVPWVQCSDFAKKRAKIKQKKEDKKLLDGSEKA